MQATKRQFILTRRLPDNVIRWKNPVGVGIFVIFALVQGSYFYIHAFPGSD
ncbi:MAG: hypothetical protein GYA17_03145 [Chloroflexi bacterium]|jgi:hypothetical protein|nr:hypothetical protein [Anaerolineaceae bacterium]NMB87328.1 hypothetical protein [Chloroflexota bacterium]